MTSHTMTSVTHHVACAISLKSYCFRRPQCLSKSYRTFTAKTLLPTSHHGYKSGPAVDTDDVISLFGHQKV